MASIFAVNKNEQRDFVKVPRSARSKFSEIESAYYVKCHTIEEYPVMENIELRTLFYSDELEAEDFSDDDDEDESPGDNSLPVTTVLRGNIIATSHLRSMIDDSKLLLDIKKLYGSDFFDEAVHLFERRSSMATSERLPCNQLYLLRTARELQSML